MFWKTVDIADDERALVYRRNRFEQVLEPGRHRLASWLNTVRIEKHLISDLYFLHDKARFLLNTHSAVLGDYIEHFELGDEEVGLFYRDGHLVDVLAPGSFLALWKGVERVRVDVIDIRENFRIDKGLVGVLCRGLKIGKARNIAAAIHYAEVPDEHVGMLSNNGKLEELLAPGSYGFWKYNRSVAVKNVDLRLQSVEVSGQEILTRDRVSLRINLSASYRVVDPEMAARRLADSNAYIYRELQLRLREAVGTQALDTLLEDKESLNRVLAQDLGDKFQHYGIELLSVGVKDIVLPGDMKAILNRVVEAQKEAEANLIKRREETQAMRSLHNTAKMMENNTILMRLKELEALERVSERVGSIAVYGGLDSVMHDLVKLAPAKSD